VAHQASYTVDIGSLSRW